MNPLFQALSALEMNQPLHKKVPRAMVPRIVIRRGEPGIVASPVSAQKTQAEQLSPDVVPHDISLPEVVSPEAPDAGTIPPCTLEEVVETKNSQLKQVESISGNRVSVKVPPESHLVALTDPYSPGAENFRAFVTRLEHLSDKIELKSFQVTSCVIHEGKTLVSGNVGVTLAKYFGSRTLLIEGDLHRPTLATMFGLNKIRGLGHWWSSRDQDLAQYIYRMNDLPLWILPAGKPCDQPSDILRSDRFAKAFEQLASQFEWIVVDSTPMLPIVDVNVWSRLVDGTILVVREGVTPVKALQKGLRALDHPKLIGVVLNDATTTNEEKYADQYYGCSKQK